jgi:peptidase M28-like protein
MRNSRRMWGMMAALVLCAGGIVLLIKPWEGNAQPPLEQRTQFAEDRAGAGKTIAFDKDRALGYIKQICALGTRISGSQGMAKQQELLKKQFEQHGAKVELQQFTARQRSQAQPVAMANLIARWNVESSRRIILCAHYDTRPLADQEPNLRDQRKPFLAANDGASGAALMMELAHHMKGLELAIGVDFVLFDGEEYIFDNRAEESGGDVYFFGSEHFGREYTQARKAGKGPVYTGAVLLDLFAGKNPQFPIEANSATMAGELVEKIWKIADEVKAPAFINKYGSSVRDDHLALNRARIPAIDIIDFDYPHWHRLSDVPENCSGESMEQVARVLVVWMQRAR